MRLDNYKIPDIKVILIGHRCNLCLNTSLSPREEENCDFDVDEG